MVGWVVAAVAATPTLVPQLGDGDQILQLWSSPSGSRVLASVGGGEYVLVDVASGSVVRRMFGVCSRRTASRSASGGSPHVVIRMEDAPCGTPLSFADGEEPVWGPAPAELQEPLEGRGRFVGCGGPWAKSAGGRRVACVLSSRDAVGVFDAGGGPPLSVLAGARPLLSDLAFIQRDSRIVGYSGGVAVVWDARTGERVLEVAQPGMTRWDADRKSRFPLPSQLSAAWLWSGAWAADHVSVSPDGARIAAVRGDEGAVFDGSGVVRSVMRSPGGYFSTVQWLRDRETLVTRIGLERLAFWDVPSGALLQDVQRHASAVVSVAFSEDGARLAAAYADGQVCAWDLSAGARLGCQRSEAAPLAVWAVRDRLVYADPSDRDGVVRDVGTGRRRASVEPFSASEVAVYGALSAAGERSTAAVWGAEGVLHRFGHPGRVESVRFAPDGSRLLTGGAYGIVLWDLATGAQVARRQEWAEGPAALVYSPDGTRFVSGHEDGTIRIWRASDGAPLGTLAVDDADRWVIVDPSGRCDGGAGCANRAVVWVVGDAVLTTASMERLYRDPQLLAKLFGFDARRLRAVPSLTRWGR